MSWFLLVIAGLFEIGWAVGLKYTEGFTKFFPSLFTGIAMAVSVVLLSYALRVIPIGTGYAVWTGIGASGTLLFGMYFLGESRDPIRIGCILLIVACVVVLKFTAKEA
jgi:quaternary ammonium compound-resistance protein SugE